MIFLQCQKEENDRCEYSFEGNHCFVLDEQIGLRCKFYDFVSVEIKHYLPSWVSSQVLINSIIQEIFVFLILE